MTSALDTSPEAVEHLAAALLSRRHENFVDHHISQESAALLHALSGDRDRLQAEVAALMADLRKYGGHHPGCSWYGDSRTCTCGLDAALARGGQG